MSCVLEKYYLHLKSYGFTLAAIFFITFMAIVGHAQQSIDFSYKNIGKQIRYFEDKTASLALADVEKLSDSVFKPGQEDILNFGNTSSAWWIKLNYTAQAHLPVYLIIDAPNIENIDAFTTDSMGKAVSFKTGCLRPAQPRVLIRNNFMLDLPISAKTEKKTVYLRLKTNNILLAPIKLATAESVLGGQEVKLGIEYIYIGLLIGLLLYNLFLFISLRDITYLYYVLYVLTLSSYLLIYIRGYAFILGDELRILFNHHPHVFLSFSVIASLLFCNKFLHLKRTGPRMIRFFYVIGALGVLLFLVSMAGFKPVATVIAQLLTVTVAIVAWIAGLIAYRNGHKPAKYYILAWLFIWVTVAIVTMSLAGIIQTNEFTIQLVSLGSTFELLLLSFALGDRYKAIVRAEQQARDENLLLVKTQNQRLEESVNERTVQLHQTINKLEDSNAVKNKLFSIIAHDLRSPLNSLLGILSLSDMGMLSSEELRLLIEENKKTIKSVNHTLNNLLYWAQNQMNGLVTQLETFEIKTIFSELLVLYLPLIKKKTIQLEEDIQTDGRVTADENQINLVLRNLIDNAIKFTPIGGRISFSLNATAENVEFAVSNEVSNPSDIDVNKMMGDHMTTATLGTTKEQGVGLGLLLCKEYVKNNGGTFHIQLEGNLISISFVLPKNH